MTIAASDVMKLREMTGAGLMEAKGALTEAGGDMEKAADMLRKSGAAKAAKKAERTTAEGRVHAYAHTNGKLAVLVEVMCETDFVARNEQFVEFCSDLAMHIAASAPRYVSRDQVPADVIEKERAIVTEMLAAENKPADIMAKIVDGRMNKFFADMCLMEQQFVKDDSMTITQLLEEKVRTIGEAIRIGRFSRVQLGVE